ncbi:helix-turn-helix transcriptional regulator [Crossiella sp. CA-258035]|uniref:helix-turn-helix transcriptional regulator n=1 Tax=Crossiella sp. CA-258035 TaxID=2981138 RepID=UPI0024BCB679|nr:helix-turn-helix transcriptional regulator [Crossiella sp. CA-258035]WHT16562.1 helix-turn-helix transcriptional regulator [Crossiella sp. CA-258035]
MRAESGARSRELASGTPWPAVGTDQDCAALRATSLMVQGRNWADSVRFAEVALSQPPCRDDPVCVWRALVTLTAAGELTAADARCARLVEDVDPQLAGTEHRLAMMLRVRARIAVQRGDLAGARATLEELLTVPAPRPVRLVSAGWLAEVLVGMDAVDQAAALLARHDFDAAVQWRAPCRPMLLAARGEVRVAAGQAQAGLRDHLASGRGFLAQRVTNPAIAPWRGRAALAAMTVRREDLAVDLAEQELAAAQRWGEPRVLGAALATVAVVRGGDEVEQLSEAADLLEVARARRELSLVRYQLGVRLAARNELSAARSSLSAARALAERVGDPRGQRAAEAALRGLGGPTEALTGKEEQVARLARAGLGNREIADRLAVSVRTVELRLSSAYRKLGIAGRDGLRTALR